jgi:hypothetical protein
LARKTLELQPSVKRLHRNWAKHRDEFNFNQHRRGLMAKCGALSCSTDQALSAWSMKVLVYSASIWGTVAMPAP